MIMGSSRLFFCSILVYFVTLSSGQGDLYLFHFCSNDRGNFTANDAYQNNLDHLLSSLPSNTKNSNGFYNDSIGKSSDKVYALALCRGDVKPDDCLSCMYNATADLKSRCPNHKEAIGWYEHCMLRYSNNNTFGVALIEPTILMWNIGNTSSTDEINYGAVGLIYTLIDKISDPEVMFVKSVEGGNGTLQRYGMVQCTRDLNSSACHNCLGQLVKFAQECCQRQRGWRVLGPSCNIRFEEYLFWQSSPPTSLPVPAAAPQPPLFSSAHEPSPSPNSKGKSSRLILLTAGDILLNFSLRKACIVVALLYRQVIIFH